MDEVKVKIGDAQFTEIPVQPPPFDSNVEFETHNTTWRTDAAPKTLKTNVLLHKPFDLYEALKLIHECQDITFYFGPPAYIMSPRIKLYRAEQVHKNARLPIVLHSRGRRRGS